MNSWLSEIWGWSRDEDGQPPAVLEETLSPASSDLSVMRDYTYNDSEDVWASCLPSFTLTLPNDLRGDPTDRWWNDNGVVRIRLINPHEQEKLAHLDRLKYFLATAPSRWDKSGASSSSDPYPPHVPSHPALNRFLLPSQEYVTCVLWNGLYHITGTDIVRALVFRCVLLLLSSSSPDQYRYQLRSLRPARSQREKV
jgi:hypothetical protein